MSDTTDRMRSVRKVSLLIAVVSNALCAQQAQPWRFYMKEGVVQRHGTSATVVANHPRPLWQAIRAVGEEYIWVVHYEEPPYKALAGGYFESTFTEGPNIFLVATDEEKQQILGKIVSDYNQSPSPGNFIVRKQTDGSYAVIGNAIRDTNGVLQPVGPFLDTTISIPAGTRDGLTTLSLILQALTVKSGIRTIDGTVPRQNLYGVQVTIGGDNVLARTFLMQTVSALNNAMSNTFVWDLEFDPSGPQYVLNLTPTIKPPPPSAPFFIR
jgi:hypothetical protein